MTDRDILLAYIAGHGGPNALSEAAEVLSQLKQAEKASEALRTLVTGCQDCPLRGAYVGGDGVCNLADRAVEESDSAPDWCPLRKAPHLVQLRTGGS